jgi:hypothetical protein
MSSRPIRKQSKPIDVPDQPELPSEGGGPGGGDCDPELREEKTAPIATPISPLTTAPRPAVTAEVPTKRATLSPRGAVQSSTCAPVVRFVSVLGCAVPSEAREPSELHMVAITDDSTKLVASHLDRHKARIGVE